MEMPVFFFKRKGFQHQLLVKPYQIECANEKILLIVKIYFACLETCGEFNSTQVVQFSVSQGSKLTCFELPLGYSCD